MEQKAMFKEALSIMFKYCSVTGRLLPKEIRNLVSVILWRRGINIDKPMFATAFALALRDVLNELEGTYTNPAEL